MDQDSNQSKTGSGVSPTIFILSGGVGASGEQLIYTVLAQFPGNDVRIQTIGNIRQPAQITQALKQAQAVNGFVIYTLVDAALRNQLVNEAKELNVQAIDLMGPLISWLSSVLGQEPLQQPGKYREMHREYYDRVAAIDFTLAHDDGKNKEGWPQADLVLVGVSRSGKTPLSVYLAILGWKVANIPLVPEIPVHPSLFELDSHRVFGLTIDSQQLMVFRRQRQARLGVSEVSTYTDLEAVEDELHQAQKIFRRGSFQIVNMTDKTIEQGADEIIRRLAGQSGSSKF